jgi:hypothetical protein
MQHVGDLGGPIPHSLTINLTAEETAVLVPKNPRALVEQTTPFPSRSAGIE